LNLLSDRKKRQDTNIPVKFIAKIQLLWDRLLADSTFINWT